MVKTLINTSSTFADNMKLPVHRWFRYSAGFSAMWVENLVSQSLQQGYVTVLDPFAGSGTTLLACEKLGVECYGVEAHPFITRVAKAKLLYKTDVESYKEHIQKIIKIADNIQGSVEGYPKLIRECFKDFSLECLDKLQKACLELANNSPQSELAWLTLIAILRHVSHVGTAPWQYVLPNKSKQSYLEPTIAFTLMAETVASDMKITKNETSVTAQIIQSDARYCHSLPDNKFNLVITSPQGRK